MNQPNSPASAEATNYTRWRKAARRPLKEFQQSLFEIKKRGPKIWRLTSPFPQEIVDAELKLCTATPRSRIQGKFDLTGKKQGRLTVERFIGSRISPPFHRMWLCRCECGKYKAVTSRDLKSAQTRSCGCLHDDNLRSRAGGNKLAPGESAFNQLFYNYKKSSRERGYAWALEKEEFRQITKGICFYCGSEPVTKYRAVKGTNGDYIGNGIDRVDNMRGYLPGNVRSCCWICNTAKASLTEGQFADWVRKVFARIGVPQ